MSLMLWINEEVDDEWPQQVFIPNRFFDNKNRPNRLSLVQRDERSIFDELAELVGKGFLHLGLRFGKCCSRNARRVCREVCSSQGYRGR